MIAKLRGKVDTIGDDFCIVDVNGVGYLVFASAKSLGKLKIGAEASLLIETVVREDSISLFGFADAWEKRVVYDVDKSAGRGYKGMSGNFVGLGSDAVGAGGFGSG